jgi:hypothetical protein
MAIWEYMDLSRSEPKLYIKGKNKFATVSGAILYFFAFIGICVISLNFFLDFFKGSQFSLIYSQINDYDKQINFSEIPIMFAAKSQRGGFLNSSISYFSAQYVNISNNILQFTPLKYETCDIDKHFYNYRDLFSSMDVSSYYCFSRGQNITIWGNNNDKIKGSGSLSLYIAKCDNSSIYNPNPGKCASPSTIEDAINSSPAGIGFMTVSFVINHNNVTNPFTPYIYNDLYPASDFLIYRNFLYMTKTFYTQDNGYIFENKNTSTHYQTGLTTFNIYVNTTLYVKEAFGIFSLVLSEKADTYLKIYVKLQMVIANVGGIIQSLLLIAALLNYQFKHSLLIIELINDFFLPEENENKHFHFDGSLENIILSRSKIQNTPNIAVKQKMYHIILIYLN